MTQLLNEENRISVVKEENQNECFDHKWGNY